jgi:hypothetical protein
MAQMLCAMQASDFCVDIGGFGVIECLLIIWAYGPY